MYNNIGEKIKGLAKSLALIGTIISVIIGINLIVKGSDSYYDGRVLIYTGIGVILVGTLVSWIWSWFMYGFGELIEKTAEIARNTAGSLSGSLTAKITTVEMTNAEKLKVLLEWKENDLISEEEFEIFKIRRPFLKAQELVDGNINERLLDLKNEFESGKITQQEYDYRRKALLDEW
jgi:hypothetical protein